MIVRIVCKTCSKVEIYEFERVTRERIYCRECARKRQKSQINFSNKMAVTGRPSGRPYKIVEHLDNKNVFSWDGSNELGY